MWVYRVKRIIYHAQSLRSHDDDDRDDENVLINQKAV